MSNKKINLEEILMSGSIGTLFRGTCNEKTYQFILGRMKEACRQTLELAAKNAETEKEILPECGVLKSVGVVDKQSILDTINQVE